MTDLQEIAARHVTENPYPVCRDFRSKPSPSGFWCANCGWNARMHADEAMRAAIAEALKCLEADACFRQAAARTHSPSDRLAFLLDARLVRHPELLATDGSYPGWAEHIAALQAANRTARKEVA